MTHRERLHTTMYVKSSAFRGAKAFAKARGALRASHGYGVPDSKHLIQQRFAAMNRAKPRPYNLPEDPIVSHSGAVPPPRKPSLPVTDPHGWRRPLGYGAAGGLGVAGGLYASNYGKAASTPYTSDLACMGNTKQAFTHRLMARGLGKVTKYFNKGKKTDIPEVPKPGEGVKDIFRVEDRQAPGFSNWTNNKVNVGGLEYARPMGHSMMKHVTSPEVLRAQGVPEERISRFMKKMPFYQRWGSRLVRYDPTQEFGRRSTLGVAGGIGGIGYGMAVAARGGQEEGAAKALGHVAHQMNQVGSMDLMGAAFKNMFRGDQDLNPLTLRLLQQVHSKDPRLAQNALGYLQQLQQQVA